MLRLGLALALVVVVALAGPARASGTGSWRALGMYATGPGGAAPAVVMPMVESKIEVTVRGALVEAVVTQTFVNRSDRPTEATYIFPLPHDAAVSAMSIKIGARTIKAAIERRADAQRRYEEAVRSGVMAATLERERSDVFTQTVTAVPAKGRVAVTLRFDAAARFADGTWSLALPMVVAPRFVPGTASGRGTTGSGRSPDTDRAPDASRITPGAAPGAGGATTMVIAFADPVKDVASPTHDVTGRGPYTLVDPKTDHDAVIRWTAVNPAAGWIEATKDGGFAAVVVQAADAPSKRPALRAVFVLDRAATMKGDATVVAQPLVRTWFARLRSDDRVALMTGAQAAFAPPGDALKAIEAAWRQPSVAFDLTRVLQAMRPTGAPLVLISDGLVADEAAALAAARALGAPIHVVGVGAAPARGLLAKLAAITGGTIRFVQPADDLAAVATGLAMDLASAPAPLAVNWGTLAVSDVVPATLPRLGAGQAVLVVAKVKRAQTANVRVRGALFAIEPLTPGAPIDGAVTVAGPLARRWAQLRLEDLLLAPRPDAAAITTHALAYGLVSPHTTLVAIGSDVVVEGGVKHSIAVPVSVPAGMHWLEVKQETTPVPPRDFEANLDPTAPEPAPTVTKKRDDDTAWRQGDDAEKTRKTAIDTGAGGESADDEEDTGRDVATVDALAPDAPMGGAMAEMMVLARSSIAASTAERGWRLSTVFGGGLSIQAGDRSPLFAFGLRFDAGRGQNLFGVEATLHAVSGPDLDGQGRILLSYARLAAIAPFLELGAGLGAHAGAGLGPAWSVSLRIHVPPQPRLAGYLRYDGALLIQESAVRQTQTTTTIGVEWGF